MQYDTKMMCLFKSVKEISIIIKNSLRVHLQIKKNITS